MTPRLTIVGAGPGDVDLITLKAIKAIKSADVILFDALVNEELLQYASRKAEKIFVGKRKGCYAYQQSQINDIIVERALRCGHVVRLKGGDPFIFGRGAEELEYAKDYAIEVAIVPGISSSAAVPAYQGIPLTKRNAAESFWVITGTTKSHEISSDIALAAKSTATIVILMGMGKLSEIVQIFSKEGKSNTAVAVIQNGTRVNEKIGIGTISTIEALVKEKQLSTPAIIIIGEVVNQRVDLTDIYSKADIAMINSKRKTLSMMERNNLYPIFLKVKNLEILIVGGGFVAEEKLTFLLKSSPDAKVTIVSPMFREGTVNIAKTGNVNRINDVYNNSHLEGKHIVIATTDNPDINIEVYNDCRAQSKLVNVADNPPYCDFYMGGIVTKGNVKVAISTNGKSPTTAKRLRQFFEDVLPENIDDLVKNLNVYRKTIKGDFEQKVEKLNEFTKGLVEKL